MDLLEYPAYVYNPSCNILNNLSDSFKVKIRKAINSAQWHLVVVEQDTRHKYVIDAKLG
jgi:hypothetical protein